MSYSSKRKKASLFSYLLALSFLFLFVQISVFVTANASVNFITLAHQDNITHIPSSAIYPMLTFMFTQFALTFLFACLIWAEARLLGRLFHWKWNKTCKNGFTLWFIAALTIILANQWYSPASTFNAISGILFPNWIAIPLLIAGCTVLFISTILSLLALIDILIPKKLIWRTFTICFIFCAAIGIETTHHVYAHNPAQLNNNDAPNIIIIGLDSLRPDYTGFMGGSNLTPNLDQFLQHATIFDNAITPLARTFPSWTAMLTGLSPIHNGVRYNLTQQQNLSFPTSFAHILQQHGYYTIYSTDERRFSNITTKYGFNQIISPPDGINDFLIGTINDLPLSNLVLNTRAGQYLFPFNYGNRASYENYHPKSFNDLLEHKLLASNPNHQPMLIIVHFCLPHWPYAWAKQDYEDALFPDGLYRLSTKRADQQAGQFIHFLTDHHYLDHAIVIVLSDHGEGLMLPNDRLIKNQNFVKGSHSDPNIFDETQTAMKIGNTSFDNSYGHGTDVLTYAQYHTVFAFKTFGLKNTFTAGHINDPVSMLDIKPTLLSLLHFPYQAADGISLQPYLYQPKLATQLDNRIRFTESGFSPAWMKGGKIAFGQIILPSRDLYLVNPSNTIGLNPALINKILPLKQRAVLYQNWLLALFPHDYLHTTAILVNRQTGQWTDDLTSPFAQKAPTKMLLAELKTYYGKEITGKYPFTN